MTNPRIPFRMPGERPGIERPKGKPLLNRAYTRAGVPDGHKIDLAGGKVAST